MPHLVLHVFGNYYYASTVYWSYWHFLPATKFCSLQWLFSNCNPRNLNIYFMSASQMWVKKTFVLNMSHVLTGVNSMMCVQLMLQTEPLGTVLALVGFLSSMLSWMRMTLSGISASFYVAPCTGLTCQGDSATGEGWRCMIMVVAVAWFLTEMWHYT